MSTDGLLDPAFLAVANAVAHARVRLRVGLDPSELSPRIFTVSESGASRKVEFSTPADREQLDDLLSLAVPLCVHRDRPEAAALLFSGWSAPEDTFEGMPSEHPEGVEVVAVAVVDRTGFRRVLEARVARSGAEAFVGRFEECNRHTGDSNAVLDALALGLRAIGDR